MRPSNKTRNRNKGGNRRGNPGNIINRVFESAGPEGRVRGTPQQIIDKYISLTHDSQLSGDRVAAENFQQHAEHYSRLLNEAQKDLAERQNDNQLSNNQKQLMPQKEQVTADSNLALNTEPNNLKTPETKLVSPVGDSKVIMLDEEMSASQRKTAKEQKVKKSGKTKGLSEDMLENQGQK